MCAIVYKLWSSLKITDEMKNEMKKSDIDHRQISDLINFFYKHAITHTSRSIKKFPIEVGKHAGGL